MTTTFTFKNYTDHYYRMLVRYRKFIGLVLVCLLIASIQVIYSHTKINTGPTSPAENGVPGISPATLLETSTPLIAISNLDEKSIEIYNYKQTTWNSATREWAFKPTAELGYSPDAIPAMGDGVGDMKWHNINGFSDKARSAFVIQGGRYLAVGVYTPVGNSKKGDKLWEHIFPADQNPNNHAVELLPDGNVAVAGFGDATAVSAYGNWVRIYNTADPSGSGFVETRVIGPHALMMDTVMNRLWVAGQVLVNGHSRHGLFAYIIGGTRSNPTLTEDLSKRAVLPYGNPASPNGIPDKLKFPHDIAPDFDDDNLMYYGDHTGVYIYNKTSKIYTSAPAAAHVYKGSDITLKSAGKQAGAYYFATYAYDRSHQYSTNKVEFFDPVNGSLAFTRTVNGFTIYRARLWTSGYQ